jgi:hypothetical protein
VQGVLECCDTAVGQITHVFARVHMVNHEKLQKWSFFGVLRTEASEMADNGLHDRQAYTLSEELHQWLLFDDTNIKLIGQWKDVAASIRNSRHQPSLLFYEHVARPSA